MTSPDSAAQKVEANATSAKPEGIRTLQQYLDELERLRPTNMSLRSFFRGHEKTGWNVLPSLKRGLGGGIANMLGEEKLIRDVMAAHSDEFRNDRTTMDVLARIQHHGGPSRLLDVTSNPLVALYFACLAGGEDDGEVIYVKIGAGRIKYFDSDTVSCLANLAWLDIGEKGRVSQGELPEEVARRLLHFIRQEKPHFDQLFTGDDLRTAVVVHARMNSKRILAQSGAFLLFGQVDNIDRAPGIEMTRIAIDGKSKASLIDRLDGVGINQSTLFPDIDNHLRYLQTPQGLRRLYYEERVPPRRG
jgi:hypothetical protein